MDQTFATAQRPLQRLRRGLEGWARPRRPEALPVAIDRRRIYVLPTGFGVFFLCLLLAMGVGALNYNNNPALLLCLLLGGAANAGLFAAHLQLSGLRVPGADAEPVPAGATLRLRVHLQAAPGRARRGLLLEHVGALAAFSLEGGRGEAELPLATERRGWLEPGRLRISTTRPFGFARAWCWVWPDTPLLVYPRPEAQGPPLPSGRGAHAIARLNRTGEDVHHLRGYRPGDVRRAIAWKASARRDALLVREFEQPLAADVVLDWRALGALAYEERIARLARWVDQAEREGRRSRLLLPGLPPIGPGRGEPHRHACLRALALLPHAPVA